jgi:Invasin, domain 3
MQNRGRWLATAVLLLLACSGGGSSNTPTSPTAPVVPTLVPAKYLVTSSSSAPTTGTSVTLTAQLATSNGVSVPTSGRTVNWSASGAGGSFASSSSTTDATGKAAVVFTTGTTAGTSYTFTATDNSAITGQSAAVTTVAGIPSTTASSVTAGAQSIPANGTSTVVITVQLRDAAGTALQASGGTLTMSTSKGTLSAVTDSANGRYIATLRSTFGGAQTATVTASLGGSALTQTAAVNFTVGAAAQYIVTAAPIGPATAPVVGQPMTVSAQLLDVYGAPVPTAGRVVTWSKLPNYGSFASATSSTDASGIATVLFTSDSLVNTYSFTATESGGVKGSTQTAIRTVAGPGVSYTVATTVTQLVAGGTAAFTAQLRDAAGNAAPGMGLNKSVTWSTTSTGGSFSSATSPVDSGGVARVTLTVGSTVGQSLTVSGTDAQGITGRSPAYTATAGTVTTVRLTSPRILLLPLGNTSFSATFQALNEFGLQLPVSFTYAAHGGAATISPSGLVSAVGVGQAMLTAFDPSGLVGDSALVAVVDPAGTYVHTDLTAFDLKKDTVRTVTVLADMRASGEKLGAITLQVLWDPTALTYVSDAEGASSAGATVNATNAATGSLTLTVASASGLAGATELRRITFRVANAAKKGTLQLLASEFVGAGTFNSLLAKALVLSNPFYTR